MLRRALARLTRHRVVRYLLAGGLSNLVSYMLFVAVFSFGLRHHAVPSYIVASLLAMPLSFFLNRLWVFGSHADLGSELRRFTFVYAVSIAAGVCLLVVLLRIVPGPVVVTQALATVALVTCVFLTHTLWTFARRGPRPGPSHR
jgi:putative flippase GtrA